MDTSKETKTELEDFIKDPNSYGVSDKAMDEIYTVGCYYGIFSETNSGRADRHNSVYCYLETLKALLK